DARRLPCHRLDPTRPQAPRTIIGFRVRLLDGFVRWFPGRPIAFLPSDDMRGPRSREGRIAACRPSLSTERSAEPSRCQPHHPSEILRQTALAREPSRTRNLDNRAVFIAQEFQRTPDAPFREKSVWCFSDEIFEAPPNGRGLKF